MIEIRKDAPTYERVSLDPYARELLGLGASINGHPLERSISLPADIVGNLAAGRIAQLNEDSGFVDHITATDHLSELDVRPCHTTARLRSLDIRTCQAIIDVVAPVMTSPLDDPLLQWELDR